MSQSASSDYFDNDPDFLEALANLSTPEGDQKLTVESSERNPSQTDSQDGMPPPNQLGLKRRRSLGPEDGQEDLGISHHNVISSIDQDKTKSEYLTSHTYGASRFGEFGEYMHRKRQKLQIQNAEIEEDNPETAPEPSMRIFRGLQIYINGWTEPSVQQLRQLIIRHGGVYHAYLDKKSLVTHVITCSLTPAKIREFKNMKVATPEWLLKSVEAGVLLPWHEFKYKPAERHDESQGKTAGQKSLFDGFVSQQSKGTPTSSSESNTVDLNLVDDAEESWVLKHPQVPQQVPGPTPADPPVVIHENLDVPTTPTRPRPGTPTKPANTTPTRPLLSTDPSTPEKAARVPGYATDKSNVAAQRAMADPAWRAAHTSVAPDFIEGFYRNSRLHHLSTWKAELRNLVTEAQERAENGSSAPRHLSPTGSHDISAVSKVVRENMSGKNWAESGRADDVSMQGARLVGKGKSRDKADESAPVGERVIMHCDFDSFFVSAGLVDRPHLRGKPVVVCHSQGAQGGQSSTSEIASASYEARKFGVKGGMSLQQARKLCPTVLTIPYEFQRYKQFSLQFYTILMSHADDLQAVSVDEALIDATNSMRRITTELSLSQGKADTAAQGDPAKDFAEAIRDQVRAATGCEVSIGIAHNVMLARLASRRAKPAGSFHLLAKDIPAFMDTLDIDDLHGFGSAAHQKSQEKLGATSLRELAKKSKSVLCDALGKGTGETLYKAIRGIDDKKLESDKPRRSVSCDINYGIRFENNEQAEAFAYQLSEEVSRRLKAISMCGRSLTLKVMVRDPDAPVEAPKFMGHGLCESFTKQMPLIAPGGRATSNPQIIGDHAWKLLKSWNFDPKELRGIGIQVQKLEKVDGNNAGVDQEQAVLPFKPVVSPKKSGVENKLPDDKGISQLSVAIFDLTASPPIPVAAPQGRAVPLPQESSSSAAQEVHDLPSFSQVDMSVFDALPADVRSELETEYKRRSVTPALGEDQRLAVDKGKKRAQSVSIFPEVFPAPRKILVKGTSNMNVKHITRQLAPKNRTSLSPTKTTLFNKKQPVISSAVSNSVKLKVSEADLRKLDIDPQVFAALPPDLQREQLALAKHTKAPEKGATSYVEHRKVLKPRKRTRLLGTPGIVIPPPPPPQAQYPDPPTLKQRGKKKGEKLYFTETDDVQDVVERWFSAFREKPPNTKDVEFFETWLVRCVDGSISTDGGVEKAVKVMKWWMVLLRREFGQTEEDIPQMSGSWSMSERPSSVDVGQAWWAAFRGVKEKMDEVARRKFGGRLSLR
ncbi:DNA repair protein [Trametopsis cervina]|nr:DNA repair protein [Trametopsis cervina]